MMVNYQEILLFISNTTMILGAATSILEGNYQIETLPEEGSSSSSHTAPPEEGFSSSSHTARQEEGSSSSSHTAPPEEGSSSLKAPRFSKKIEQKISKKNALLNFKMEQNTGKTVQCPSCGSSTHARATSSKCPYKKAKVSEHGPE